MLIIIACFIAGILAGIALRGRTRILGRVSKATDLAVGFLLFVLGVSIGVNEEVIANLPSLGLEGLALSLGAIAGSIAAVSPLKKLFAGESA